MTSNFMLGVGNILYARRANTHAERRHHQDDALSYFLAADNIDTPKTANFYFHYGLITAESRQINSAIKLVQKALMLDPNHSGSYNLLALLLSSTKQFEKALRFIKLGLQKDPQHIPMLATMAAIEAVMDPSAAHKTYERLVDLIEVEMFRSKWNLWEGEDRGDLR
jgi:tetratricopeptide (TPR) repeat protein